MERRVVVVSGDAGLRGEVEAALARNPDVRAVFAGWEDARRWRPAQEDRVLVVDDEGEAGAVQWIEKAKAQNGDVSVIYLAARHSVELERHARRAGASYYVAKATRGHTLSRVIETMLRI